MLLRIIDKIFEETGDFLFDFVVAIFLLVFSIIQLMRYNKSSCIYSIEVELDKDKLYYLYGVDVFEPESTIMVGKLESSLGKTVTIGDFDLFQVYESGKYRINYHRIDGNIELMVIL